MAYREEEQVRLRRQTTKQAVALAMQGRWREAIAANKSLLENFPNDVDAYNRLGRAYMELGEYAQAKEAYARAQELDPYNSIARKNLDRLAHLEEAAGSADTSHKVEPHLFIEETGKAGVVRLHHLAPQKVLAKMVSGDMLLLKKDSTRLIVESDRGEYIGQVEPRHSQRLIKLMEGGNKYAATFINSSAEVATIIIREIYQDPSQAGKFSFPPRGLEHGRPYPGDRLLRRELPREGELLEEELGYAPVSGEEGEFLTEEPIDMMDRPEVE
jgi:tetratricopeptide (TPR) repeat protein